MALRGSWRRLAPMFSAGLTGSALGIQQQRRQVAQAEETGRRHVRVAFVGNSYLYFNDVPRVFQALCHHHGIRVDIKDCLRGGASFKSLLQHGNGMEKKFNTPAAMLPDGSYDVGAPTVEALLSEPEGWDFVVANTYSQECAILSQRKNGLDALDTMAPLFKKAGACPVLLVTPAYRTHAKGSEVIGDWQDFTWRQSEGMALCAQKLTELCPVEKQPRMVDANRAFEVVHGEWPELWEQLFHTDNFHPSSLGSFLEACVIFCGLFDEAPPLPSDVLEEPGQLWKRARRMLPERAPKGRMPTAEELLYLRGVAMRVSGSDAMLGVQRRMAP